MYFYRNVIATQRLRMMAAVLLVSWSPALIACGVAHPNKQKGPTAQSQEAADPYVQQIEGLSLGIEMVPVPGGTFRMGNTGEAAGKSDEKPVVSVTLEPFWISKFEIPWDIYEAFVFEKADPTKIKDGAALDGVTRPTPPYLDMTLGMGKEGFPAMGMTQYNAIQFCKWLYTRTGVFYRLPTEAEWEYAAKAGAETDYYFGTDATQLDEYAWYAANSDGKTQPIGKKAPNAFGIHDMLGNVAEWTFDQYDAGYYDSLATHSSVANPSKFPHDLYPISVRGGSFRDSADQLRTAARAYSEPAWKAIDPQTPKSDWWFTMTPIIGLRLVRPQTPPSYAEIMAYFGFEPIPDY